MAHELYGHMFRYLAGALSDHKNSTWLKKVEVRSNDPRKKKDLNKMENERLRKYYKGD